MNGWNIMDGRKKEFFFRSLFQPVLIPAISPFRVKVAGFPDGEVEDNHLHSGVRPSHTERSDWEPTRGRSLFQGHRRANLNQGDLRQPPPYPPRNVCQLRDETIYPRTRLQEHRERTVTPGKTALLGAAAGIITSRLLWNMNAVIMHVCVEQSGCS